MKPANPQEGHHARDQKLQMPWPLRASGVDATGPKLVTLRESLLGTSPRVLTLVPSCLSLWSNFIQWDITTSLNLQVMLASSTGETKSLAGTWGFP